METRLAVDIDDKEMNTALWATFRTVRLDIANLYYPRSTQAARLCLNAWDSIKLSLMEGQ